MIIPRIVNINNTKCIRYVSKLLYGKLFFSDCLSVTSNFRFPNPNSSFIDSYAIIGDSIISYILFHIYKVLV